MKRRELAAPVSALVSLLAAASCCLPIGYFVAGAGLFGLAGFFGAAQPVFLALSVVSLGLGFYRLYGRRSCALERSWTGVIMLWGAAILVGAMFLFPDRIATLLADWVPAR